MNSQDTMTNTNLERGFVDHRRPMKALLRGENIDFLDLPRFPQRVFFLFLLKLQALSMKIKILETKLDLALYPKDPSQSDAAPHELIVTLDGILIEDE
ncbi:hypothetical protein E3N88_04442 [Mikania micrantha]|uniref:Uncharacterized protein n=1 Tax=Mikania micrantha TaxID=192012 RepID=A0A5N6PUI0_9ASTR|nr:hypothetical protein E3N88_04442 [Mikania micrantha]